MNLSFSYETIIHYLQIALDIIVVWILLNYVIKIAKATQRTIQLFQGVVLIVIIQNLAKLLGLTTVAWLANNIVSWGFLAIIVIFQPEIRSILERLGKSNALARISVLSSNEKEQLVDELVAATANLAASKTGALISLEQSYSLNEYITTGVKLNSLVSAELLSSIFQTTTPLHDGAVIIQGDKIACASAYFPPTNMDLPSRYGARHRAAIGISEVSDAVTIVVSEESGRVAVTSNGKIYQMNETKLRAFLEKIILNRETVTVKEGTTTSESADITSILRTNSNNDTEMEFKNTNSHGKQMKTFQTSNFKSDVDEYEKYVNTPVRSKSSSQTFIQNIVKEVTNNTTQAPVVNDDEKPRITIKTVPVPKTRQGETTIRTNRVTSGNAGTEGGKR